MDTSVLELCFSWRHDVQDFTQLDNLQICLHIIRTYRDKIFQQFDILGAANSVWKHWVLPF